MSFLSKRKAKNLPYRSNENEELLTVDIDDLTISYKKSGSGPPLVFFHGWIGHEDTFALCHEAFARHFTVYRPAWPGYGGSTRMPSNFTIDDFVELGRKFMLKLGLKDVTLIGNCLGGNVAIELIQRYPEMIKKLILVEVHAYFPKYLLPLVIPGINWFIYILVFRTSAIFNFINSFMPIQQSDVKDDWPYVWEGFKRTPIRSALTYLKAIYRFSKVHEKLYVESFRLDKPVLYVEGGRTFGPVGAFSRLVRIHFKNLEIVSIPEGEHNPVCERPEIFNERVLGALGFEGS